MTNILSIPEEISENLSFFQPVYSKPQFCRFIEHILSRIIDSRFSTYSIPDHFYHKVNPSTENRFLTESTLDDTLAHKKYAKKMDGVGKHKDHLNNTFSNGHDIVTIGIYTLIA